MTPTQKHTPPPLPPDRVSVKQRDDGSIVVRVQSSGPEGSRLPDAVFSFRCGDPQYSYWLEQLQKESRGTGQ